MKKYKPGGVMIKKYMLPLILLLLMSCAATQEKIETVFYPALPQNPRLQFLTSITSEDDIGKEKSAFREFLLGETKSMKQVARPYDIASVPGKIYVSDRTYKKILVIDFDKMEFNFIKDEAEGSLDQPAGIWITPSGNKYIADFGRKQIVVFNDKDEFVTAYGREGQFGKPLDVAVQGKKMYVVDFDNHHIAVVDLDSGETIHTIGGSGAEPGKMHRPSHIALDTEGNIYVDDSFNFRIQKFSPDGQFQKVYGYPGDTLGGFARPKGIAVDAEGYLYAVDTAFENVQIFDNESALLLLFFGGFGPNPGSMYLPNSVYMDYDNIKYFQKYVDKNFNVKYLVYVGNMLGEHKINVYGFGEWTGKPLPDVPRRKIELD
ncbi:MAG: hypothetical protein C4581_14060 [Nitrospiraceae bacterium]|nr:MAG: hypothetical protein C4581_14060 [Nitrospiraceae bacterium]